MALSGRAASGGLVLGSCCDTSVVRPMLDVVGASPTPLPEVAHCWLAPEPPMGPVDHCCGIGSPVPADLAVASLAAGASACSANADRTKLATATTQAMMPV